MIETSLGITAAAHFAPLLDYADLDGAALLANDPVRRRDDRRRANPDSRCAGARRNAARIVLSHGLRLDGTWRYRIRTRSSQSSTSYDCES